MKAIDCIRNDSPLPIEINLTCFEFTWNCPSVQQPDFGKVVIDYRPDKAIAETKSLKFYLQQYRDKNAFNEELALRILQDFVYHVRPAWVRVRLEQNSRGGIFNNSQIEWSNDQPFDYTPKRTFQGGWPMLKAHTHQATGVPDESRTSRRGKRTAGKS